MLLKFVLSILIIFFTCPLESFAQHNLTGSIQTKDKEPISGATILLHSVSDSTKVLLTYTTSNEKGFYSLSTPKNPSFFLITAQADNYKTIEKKINILKEAFPEHINFTLHPSLSYLDTVKINLKFGISKSGDTLTFNPETFSLGNENTISKLLARIPGIRIHENGKISFNGSPVSGVLIDGDDLFKENYELLTQNASPEIIDKIEVIRNYQKDQLLKEFNKSGSQVINLSLKEKFKNYFFGNTAIGYGNENNKLADIF